MLSRVEFYTLQSLLFCISINLMSTSEFNQNDQNKKRKNLNALVLAVYKVTNRFPEDEILRTHLREQALNVLSHAEHVYLGDDEHFNKFIASVRTLINYCELAEKQNWMDNKNFMILKNAFFKFLNSFQEYEQKNIINRHQEAKFSLPKKNIPPKISRQVSGSSLTPRQESILKHLRQNRTTHVAQLADLLPSVSRRTIRRDLDKLANAGFISKQGKTNGTNYKITDL